MPEQTQQSRNAIEQQVINQQNQQPQQGVSQVVEPQKDNDPYAELVGAISDLDRRLRILEERYGNLRQKIQITDQNMLESERNFLKDIKSGNTDLLELKRNVNDFSEKVLMFKDEMDTTAQKKDLKVIEKYLELWNPSNFITRNELREFLKEKGFKVAPKDEESDEGNEESEEEQ